MESDGIDRGVRKKHLNLLDSTRPTIDENANDTRVVALAKSKPNPESFSKDVSSQSLTSPMTMTTSTRRRRTVLTTAAKVMVMIRMIREVAGETYC